VIRKQFYIAPAQQRKLQSLSKRWNCTEAEVVRTALDRIEEPEDILLDLLRAAGQLVEPRNEPDLPSTPEDIARQEREFEEWSQKRTEPIGLSEAVIEDRR
jgi:hypothetical protein